MRPAGSIWPLTALVLLGHAAALTLLQAPPPTPAAGGPGGTPPAFQVRTVQPAVVQPAATQPAAQPAAAVANAAPAPVAPPASPPAADSAPAVRRAPAAPASAATGAAAEAPFLQRSALTQAPRPLAPIDVPFPESVVGVVDLKVQLTLFVDEQGRVQRLRVDTPNVAPAFERAIRETFGEARFQPGELAGAAVRSQLRIEVEFSAAGGRRR